MHENMGLLLANRLKAYMLAVCLFYKKAVFQRTNKPALILVYGT